MFSVFSALESGVSVSVIYTHFASYVYQREGYPFRNYAERLFSMTFYEFVYSYVPGTNIPKDLYHSITELKLYLGFKVKDYCLYKHTPLNVVLAVIQRDKLYGFSKMVHSWGSNVRL